MNRFEYWLIADYTRVGAKDQQTFLRMLKFKPEEVVRIIAVNLEDWATIFVAKTGSVYIYNGIAEEAQRIVKDIQQHFAAELAAITEPEPESQPQS